MNIGIATTATATSGALAASARQVEALGDDSLWIRTKDRQITTAKTGYRKVSAVSS
jgi:hypothetical protein